MERYSQRPSKMEGDSWYVRMIVKLETYLPLTVGSALHKARERNRARRALELREASAGVGGAINNGESSMIQGESMHLSESIIKAHSGERG